MRDIKDISFFIVDDDKMFSLYLKKQLNKLGATKIEHFAQGIDCINKIEEDPDIILLDYNLDFMNGGEVLCKVMRHNPDIAVIMISNQNEISVAVDIIKQGAFDYLVKDESLNDKLKRSVLKYIELDLVLKNRRRSFINRLFKRF